VLNTDERAKIAHTFIFQDIHNHMEALYFSLSTMAAIGYGVSDYYFGGCWTPLLLVLAQACSAIIFHAIAVGILFQRISRGHKRGKTILFSNKAIIRRVKGIPYLMFRVAELRHHQLLEATVRAYCVRHERHAATRTDCEHKEESQGLNFPAETVHYVSRPMKLLHEEVGASRILMSLPQVVAHIIDEKSPLMPLIPAWYDVQGRSHCQQNGLFTSEDIALFWRDRDVEVVVLLEGTDELTGAAIQAKHSYSADDFAWNETFVPCVRPFVQTGDTEIRRRLRRRWGRNNASNSPVCLVDFSIFHETTPAPLDCDSCAYIE
jgi:potassium inwardly-rectifying channel subfamily J